LSAVRAHDNSSLDRLTVGDFRSDTTVVGIADILGGVEGDCKQWLKVGGCWFWLLVVGRLLHRAELLPV
jgi:hypothetical protein